MKARDIMSSPVVTVTTGTLVRDAAAVLSQRSVTSLPVLDEDGRVVGIVSEADIIRDRMPFSARNHPRPDEDDKPGPARQVGAVMSHTVICLSDGADTADVAALMLDNNIRAVPIINGDGLAGIVSRSDLLRTLLRSDAAIRAEIVERIADYTGTSAPWHISVDEGAVTIRGHFDATARSEIITALAAAVPGVLRVHTSAHRFG